ncbi:helix-turn-helix domain-containing protein [Natrinema gari]|uniref:Bacterio-opsin activator HTH domain protein n=1 Tax=Natrinema gari JCM 14663 TaxID=1230459 RepID=L9YVX2_9EURY|nr:helix-turn-helix domain-containing protein [Natrinema gari]ELY77826.1 Bacterio-opsin activator HTH domain protein [Natrinema gari JCM 14663]
MNATEDGTTVSHPGDEREIRAEIRFDLTGTDCILEGTQEEPMVRHQLMNDTCYVLSDVGTKATGVTQTETTIDQSCPCAVFRRHQCVPLFGAVEDGTTVVTTYLSDRDTLQQLIEELREVVDHVSLRRLTTSDTDEFTDVRTADISLLTEREQETLTRAIEAGYYDDPRGIEFEALASRLGISKSTLSQRLSAAESKLLLDLLEG